MRMPVCLRWALRYPAAVSVRPDAARRRKRFGRVALPYPAPVGANPAPLLHEKRATEQVPLHVQRVKSAPCAGPGRSGDKLAW